MESPIWPESLPINRKKAIQELTQGQEWTDKLREILQQSENIESDSASLDGVVDRILGMFDNTLSIMGSRTSNEPLQFLTNYLQTSYSFDEQKSKTSDLQSLCSLELDERKLRKSDETFSLQTSYLESPRSSDENKSKKYDETSRMVIPVKMKRGCHKRDTSILLNFKAKELTGNKQVNHFFQPMKHEPNEGSPSLGNQRDNQSTPSDDCLLWDLIMKVPQVPLESVSMSVGLDHEIYLWSEHGDMTSSYSSMASTERHEMDYMFESNDFKDFSF
ncbi:hypothetical protein Ccrd_002909 [Cynara cardunculus var. scolymus]|uniref:Uncharacterized protein n=1 Tax=Cynara cardunculus var. scolymus TaxID=59895 RepID=A0A124SCV8_CYNCS|nr:hypothetical protein Ccrd_002909 [Cynara cardunculus var. scolymus]